MEQLGRADAFKERAGNGGSRDIAPGRKLWAGRHCQLLSAAQFRITLPGMDNHAGRAALRATTAVGYKAHNLRYSARGSKARVLGSLRSESQCAPVGGSKRTQTVCQPSTGLHCRQSVSTGSMREGRWAGRKSNYYQCGEQQGFGFKPRRLHRTNRPAGECPPSSSFRRIVAGFRSQRSGLSPAHPDSNHVSRIRTGPAK